MGTPDFAVGALEEIIKAGHEVTAVVTQPDKPKALGEIGIGQEGPHGHLLGELRRQS